MIWTYVFGSKLVSDWASECSWPSEWVNGASEQPNGRASGPVAYASISHHSYPKCSIFCVCQHQKQWRCLAQCTLIPSTLTNRARAGAWWKLDFITSIYWGTRIERYVSKLIGGNQNLFMMSYETPLHDRRAPVKAKNRRDDTALWFKTAWNWDIKEHKLGTNKWVNQSPKGKRWSSVPLPCSGIL